jgi:hypothetical protein
VTANVPAGCLAALLFLGIAALHAYWALGGLWPGHDADSLFRTVVGPHRARRVAVSGVRPT